MLQLDLRQRARQRVDVLVRIERPRTDANGPFRESTDRAMDVRSAVQPRPNGDLERLIENAADLRGRQAFAAHAERADAFAQVAMAEHLVAADLVEAFPQPLDQLHLAVMNLVEALLLHILDAGRETGDAQDVGRAAFEEIRILARLRFAGRIAAGAAFAPGADDGAVANVKRAGACRAEQRLVAWEGEQI